MRFYDLATGDSFIPFTLNTSLNIVSLLKKIETNQETGQNTVSSNGCLFITESGQRVIKIIL